MIVTAKKEEIKSVINQFMRNRKKRIGIEKIFKFYNTKYSNYGSSLLENGVLLLNLYRLLQQFKRGQALQKII
mgnify:CR=1 FL=1